MPNIRKLSKEDVEEIKRKYDSSEGHTMASLAKDYGVVVSSISRVIHSRPPEKKSFMPPISGFWRQSKILASQR